MNESITMPLLERNFVVKYNEDGLDDMITVRQQYSRDVAAFLIYDPQKGFLFEKRIRPTDPLFDKTIIPAGKTENPGERSFPLWAATWECFEEFNVVLPIVIPLSSLFDPQQRNMLYPFLMTGQPWGVITNQEPEKKDLVWVAPDVVYHSLGGRTIVNPMFQVATTQKILLDAKDKMTKFKII